MPYAELARLMKSGVIFQNAKHLLAKFRTKQSSLVVTLMEHSMHTQVFPPKYSVFINEMYLVFLGSGI